MFHVERAHDCFTWNIFHKRRVFGLPKVTELARPTQCENSCVSRKNRPRRASARYSAPSAEHEASTSAGSTARATIQSLCAAMSSIRSARTETFDRWRLDSRRKTAFLWLDSTSVTRQSGLRIAMGIPGNPAPEPTSSTEISRFGRREMRAKEERLAVVSNYGLRARLYGRQVHPLVPTEKQLVMAVELSDLRLTQLGAKELGEPVRRGHRGSGRHREPRPRRG